MIAHNCNCTDELHNDFNFVSSKQLEFPKNNLLLLKITHSQPPDETEKPSQNQLTTGWETQDELCVALPTGATCKGLSAFFAWLRATKNLLNLADAGQQQQLYSNWAVLTVNLYVFHLFQTPSQL